MRRSRAATVASFLFLVLAVSLPGFGSAQTPLPEPVTTLTAGQTATLLIKPRQYQILQIGAIPGAETELRLELPGAGVRGRFVKIQPEPVSGPDAADAAISDSGLDFVRYPIPRDSKSPVSLHVTVLNNSKSDVDPVATQISLVAIEPSPERSSDTQALAAFNHAERLRRSHAGADKALAGYEAALKYAQAAGDAVLQQQIELSAGRMLMTDGKSYADAVSWERRAVAVPGTDSAPSVQALAWKMLGGALLDIDQYAESLEASQHALTLYQKTGETFWQGVVLENMGEAQLDLGLIPQALQTDAHALAISRDLHDDYGVVEMLAEVGSIERNQGDYQAALNDFSEAVEVTLPSSYNPMQGEAWLALGELHRELAEPERASEDFACALKIAQETKSGLDELAAIDDIASQHLERNELKEAEAGFSDGLERARALKLQRPQSGLLIGLAKTRIAENKPADAAPLLHQAVELSQGIAQDNQAAEAWAALGSLAQSQGRADEARPSFEKAAELFARVQDKAGLAQADSGLGSVEAAGGETDQAVRHMQAAMDIIESSRTSFSRGSLRTRFFAARRSTYEQAISLLMTQDRLHPEAGFAVQAWSIAERARARSLLDELWSAGQAESQGTQDPGAATMRRQLAALEVRIAALEEQQAQAGTDPGDLKSLAKVQTDLRSAVLAADEMEARIRSTVPSAAAMPSATTTPKAFATAALSPGDALAEYFVSASASYVWLLTSDGHCTGYTLPGESTLRQQTTAFREALLARNTTPAGESPRARELRLAAADATTLQNGLALGGVLFPAAMETKLAGVKRLALVLDGSLAQVPFAGLRLPGSSLAKSNYLVERFELLQEPSAAYLMLPQHTSASPASERRVAIFADPVYNLADPRLANHTSVTKTAAFSLRGEPKGALAHLARLPGSRLEAQEIAAVAGPRRSTLLLGFDATPEAVRMLDWAQYSVAHFAVHAVSDTTGRDSAGLLLSMIDKDGARENGILWVREIYGKRTASDLVVLSGCGTALGETIPGEGMNSLARGFLFSGTRQVAGTLWSTEDSAATALMAEFYRQFFQPGATTAQALRAAQLNALHSSHAAPIYWAGFVVEGQWTTR